MLRKLSLRNALQVLFKRARLFLIVAGLPVALFVVLVLPKPSEYESAASLMVKVIDQDVVAPDLFTEQQGRTAASASNMAKQIINSELMILMSEDVRRTALRRLGIASVYPSLAKKAEPVAMNLAVERLSKDFTSKVSSETSVIMLSVFNPSPETAQRTLKALIAATVEKQASVMRDPRMQFLDRKLEALRVQVESAQAELLAYKQETHISAFEEERSLLLKQRDAVESSLDGLRAQLVGAEGRGKALKETLSATPTMVPISNESDGLRQLMNQAQERAQAARARMQEARGASEADRASMQASVMQAEQRLKELRQISMSRARRELNPLSQRINVDVSLASSEVNGAQQAAEERERQLEAVNRRLSVLDGAETKLRELERKRTVAEQDYRSYLQRAQSARIVSDMNEAGITNLSIVQQPTLPHRPSRPRKGMLFMLALLAGLLCGVGACVVKELLDDRPNLPEEFEELLGAPILASIRKKGVG